MRDFVLCVLCVVAIGALIYWVDIGKAFDQDMGLFPCGRPVGAKCEYRSEIARCDPRPAVEDVAVFQPHGLRARAGQTNHPEDIGIIILPKGASDSVPVDVGRVIRSSAEAIFQQMTPAKPIAIPSPGNRLRRQKNPIAWPAP
jgi:hypothetical protein